MSQSLESAGETVEEHLAAGVLGASVRPSRPARLEPEGPPGTCANCAAGLKGPVCHRCGQLDDNYHRPIGALIGQVLEGLFHIDGRLARTVPDLVIRPGKVTRAYLKGARARFIPPFRLYLAASLIFFLLMGVMAGGFEVRSPSDIDPEHVRQEVDRALARGAIADPSRLNEALGVMPRDEEGASALPESVPGETARGVRDGQGFLAEHMLVDSMELRRALVPEDFGEPPPAGGLPLPVRRFFADKAERVAEDPEGWSRATIAWIPRIMFVLVPLYAGLLALSYVWRRGFFFYDHLIVSLHLHAALFIAMSLAVLLAPLAGAGLMIAAVLVYSNLYLYRLQRRVYARSRITSAIRVAVLDIAYLFVMAIALVTVLVLGLASV